MHLTTSIWKRLVLASLAAATVITISATTAQAYGQLSCGQLWYERNAIFARYGFCFKTQQAINTFGRGCFAPYGNLPAAAQDRVNAITAWERRKGCN